LSSIRELRMIITFCFEPADAALLIVEYGGVFLAMAERYLANPKLLSIQVIDWDLITLLVVRSFFRSF